MDLGDNQNPFIDTIVGALSTRVGLMDSVINLVWDDKEHCALVHFKAPDPDQFDELKEVIIETLREIESVKFSVAGQLVKLGSVPSLVVKITEKR